MNNIHKQRLYYIGLLAIGLAFATALILYALRQNINVFVTPSEMISTRAAYNQTYLRLGGLVKKGSLQRDPQGLGVQFIVTDFKHELRVRYTGILPDLFREGKGMIAEGRLNARGEFVATQILAKHDENYIPAMMVRVNTPKGTS